MWQKYLIRRLSVQMALVWNYGWGKAMQKVYGVSLEKTLVFGDSEKTEYWTDMAQHRKYRAGLRRLLKNKKFLRTFHKQAQLTLELILSSFKRKFARGFSSLTDKELALFYEKFIFPNLIRFFVRMWTVFNLGEQIDITVREKLKAILPEERLDEYLLKLSRPSKPNDVMQERLDLLKLAVERKKVSQNRWVVLLGRHARKYRHIPVYDFDHHPYTEKHFLSELKNIKSPGLEITQIQDMFRRGQEETKKAIAAIHPDADLKLLLKFLKENVFLRDHRDMLRQKLNLELKTFYLEAGKRLGLDIFEIGMLTSTEIVKYLRLSKFFPRREVRKRMQASLLIQSGDNFKVLSGKAAKRKFRSEIFTGESVRTGKLTGTIGSKGGPVQGTAVIVYTNKDLCKVKKGQVMFTGMTRQDFVPYLRKIAALVTDEGSVTCHAAIIARELGIPCVVNTGSGTSFSKDGDLVEVDANKGIVRKI